MDTTLEVHRLRGGLGELRVAVDGVDVVDTNRLWYPTPSSVVERVRDHLRTSSSGRQGASRRTGERASTGHTDRKGDDD